MRMARARRRRHIKLNVGRLMIVVAPELHTIKEKEKRIIKSFTYEESIERLFGHADDGPR
jgi:hypothetical protein